MFLPVAEVSTVLWFFVVIVLVTRRIFGITNSKNFNRYFSLSWFLYCVPIHIHGFIPFFWAKEMTEMDKHPDIYFGAYPSYCLADPRYCSNDIFIQMIQMGTALVITPQCILAFLGILNQWPWRNAIILVVSALQMFGTVLFFIEPFHLDKNPIPTVGFKFYFEFLFMNNLWIWIPFWLIRNSLSEIMVAQRIYDTTVANIEQKFD